MQPFNEAIGNKRSILRSDDSIIQNVKNSRALEVLWPQQIMQHDRKEVSN